MEFYYYRDYRSKVWNTSPGFYWEGGVNNYDIEGFLSVAGNPDAQMCACCMATRLVPWENRVDAEDSESDFILQVCPACGWWKVLEYKKLKYIPGYDSGEVFYSYSSSHSATFAILDSFNIEDECAPLEEIARVLLTDWRYAKSISAKTAQDLVLSVFRNHLACDVHYYDNAVFAPDGGIDFVLVRSDKSTIAFQVKRRQTDKAESIRAVREFIGALANSPYSQGIFVTTARISPYAANEIVEGRINRKAKCMSVEVVDGLRLKSLMALHTPCDRALDALRRVAPQSGWVGVDRRTSELDIASAIEHTRLDHSVSD